MGAVTAAVIGGVAAVGSGAMAANSAKKGMKGAQASQAAALAQYNDLSTPNVSEQELDLTLPELVGQYNPEMNVMETLQESNQVQDPAVKDLQMKALQDMAEISEGGLRDEDIAAFREMRRSVEGENQANQEKILQDMQRRGTLGSGMELAAKLQGNQAATDRLSSGGDKLTQEAASRALQALAQTSNMGGQITNQNFREQAASDAINEFNTRNRQDVGNTNISSRNQAQAANLASRQALADQQVALKNQQQQYNKQLKQQEFNNQMSLASGRAGQYQGIANTQMQDAANRAASGAQMGIGIGNAVAGIANAFGNTKATTPNTSIYNNAAPSYSTSDNYKFDPNKIQS